MMKQLTAGIATVFIATAAAHAQCPEVGRPTEAFSIAEGFPIDPNRHTVTAGGDLELASCPDVPGVGWVTKLPDFVVNYRTRTGGPAHQTLTFRIDSSADTVLLINDPQQGWHYNDDSGNWLNAKLRFERALPGRYDVWVGTRSAVPSRATLVVTELE